LPLMRPTAQGLSDRHIDDTDVARSGQNPHLTGHDRTARYFRRTQRFHLTDRRQASPSTGRNIVLVVFGVILLGRKNSIL
jgi:hypothetical protein